MPKPTVLVDPGPVALTARNLRICAGYLVRVQLDRAARDLSRYAAALDRGQTLTEADAEYARTWLHRSRVAVVA